MTRFPYTQNLDSCLASNTHPVSVCVLVVTPQTLLTLVTEGLAVAGRSPSPAPELSLQPVLGGCLTQEAGGAPEYEMRRQLGALGYTRARSWDPARDGKVSLLADRHNLKV